GRTAGHAGRAARLAGRALAWLRQPARTRRAVRRAAGAHHRDAWRPGRALVRNLSARLRLVRHAAGSGRTDAGPARAHPGRMDTYLGHLVGSRQLRSLLAPARPGRTADAEPGKPVRLRAPGAVL